MGIRDSSDPQRPMAPAGGGGPLEVPLDSPDDLTKLVGIGPKIAGELTDAGISSFARLALSLIHISEPTRPY